MKTKIMGVVTIALALGTAQFARATLVDSNSIIQDGIEYYIQTDKSVYNLGENVEILFRVTNLRDTAVTIPCSRSGEFNLLVEKEGVINWMLAHFFIWSPGVEFSPGESKELSYVWDMTYDDWSPKKDLLVEPGTYDVVGIMYNEPWNYQNHRNLIPTEVEFPITIIPEPGSLALLGMGLAGLLIHNKKRKH